MSAPGQADRDRASLLPAQLIDTAEPFFFPGGPTGCLLVHGFTGTPKEMRWLGEDLARRGYSVLGVRLGGHATRPNDLGRARWRDWVASVEDGWQMLRSASQRVVVMGLSMGGALALLHAARFPAAGVVAMSTPYQLPNDWRLPYTRMLSRVKKALAKGEPDWHDRQAQLSHIDYPDYPTRAIAELNDLLGEMRQALPQVIAPALVIHSRDDHSVVPAERHAERILDTLGSGRKELRWISGSGHVITRDAARRQVFDMAAEFLESL
ncbi:MAG: alpha/beta hydrolase [Chloroflexota bacterium]